MRVKFIDGGPLSGKVREIPENNYPVVCVYGNYDFKLDVDYAISDFKPPPVGRYSSLQPGINGGPKRLVWQGYDRS